MEWVPWILALVVLGLGALATQGRFGEMPGTITDAAPATVVGSLPPGELTSDDLRSVRFDETGGGYSKAQVDEFLARLSRQLPAGSGRTRLPDDTVMLPRVIPGER